MKGILKYAREIDDAEQKKMAMSCHQHLDSLLRMMGMGGSDPERYFQAAVKLKKFIASGSRLDYFDVAEIDEGEATEGQGGEQPDESPKAQPEGQPETTEAATDKVAEKATGSEGPIDAVGKAAPKAEPKAEAKSESMPPPPKPKARPKLEMKQKAKASASAESSEASADESARGDDVSGMSQTSDPDGWIERHYGHYSSDDENASDATEECEDFDMVTPGDPTPMEVDADAEEAQQDETKEGEKKKKSDEKSEEKK